MQEKILLAQKVALNNLCGVGALHLLDEGRISNSHLIFMKSLVVKVAVAIKTIYMSKKLKVLLKKIRKLREDGPKL